MSYGQRDELWAMPESPVATKIKRPGFIKRWFNRMCEDAWRDAQYEHTNQKYSTRARASPIIDDRSVDLDRGKSLRFNVYMANGGRVVETTRYDRKTDENNTSLYIITDDQEFGKEIDKIIVMEGLRHN
jgi:hypothetical protein